ncbi:hypothetical protein V5O48_000066 [Marasmius crinis-equi]|uniref:Ubiquitin-like domain-containing protein n=1 Tax=Marasmius crinis-equi TaxID=585013 RepID=A0ABR3G2H0_9AGAR
MSLIQLRVELPTYAHSFTIQVHDICTIRDVKQEIFNVCPGSPQVNGQRIIWRGRYLSDDEKLEDIWKSADEPRIIHLSVHPSAWTSKPPNSVEQEHATSSSIPTSSSSRLPNPPMYSRQTAVPTPTPTTHLSSTSKHPLAYVLHKHKRALSILMRDKSNHDESPSDLDLLRANAVQFVESHGHQWPSILDEPFPSAISDFGGLVYEHEIIDGKTYLRLRNPSEKPTEAQTHALKVLSYTFPLLKLPSEASRPTPTIHSEPVPIPPNIHALLQQMGLPPVQGDAEHHRQQLLQHLRDRANPNERVIEINLNLRPFLLPLLMLAFRTLLLLYFVAPARKPVFGILIIAWVLYEIWQPIRNGFVRGWRNGAQAPGQEQRAGAAAAGAGQGQNQNRNQPVGVVPGQRPQGQAGQPGAAPRRNAEGGAAGAFLGTLANLDITQEEAELERGDVAEPGFRRKAGAFFTLFLATVHPAVWNRRRVALRLREGRIRTEQRALNAPPEEENAEGQEEDAEASARRTAAQESRERLRAQHERRRPWIQGYIQRVVRGEWVDDSD